MRHVLTSAGLVALGAASLQAIEPAINRAYSGRPWSISASVRGFYDDNSTTSPDKMTVTDSLGRPVLDVLGRPVVVHPRQESFGVEVRPSVFVNLPFEQTYLSAGYIYDFRWYENRSDHDIDQAHEFQLRLDHQFNPRHSISVSDNFVYSQEPTVVDQGGIITVPTISRTDSDVLHNHGAITYNARLTELLGLALGYANEWYDYDQNGPGSRSALLDRLEHLANLDLTFQVNPSVSAFVGYQIGFRDYTGDSFLGFVDRFGSPLLNPATRRPYVSDDRDSVSHYGYVGVNADITPTIRASARVGAQFTDYDRQGSDVSPYADAFLVWTYMLGGSLQTGVRHTRNATDIVSPDSRGNITLDQESTAVYASLVHKFTHDLTATVIGQYQVGCFNDGANDGLEDKLWFVGVSLEYQITTHWSVETGYNYDTLDSDIRGRNYDRNRVYVGVRVTY